MANPVCHRLGNHLEHIANNIGIKVVRGGTYLAMEGPQFSSIAESELYRSWSCDVIGMTNMPEAKLAREAEMCYASVAMVTDYDCWHPHHDNVSVDAIIKVLMNNANNARSLVKNVASFIESDQSSSKCECKTSLENSIITSPEVRDKNLVKKLEAVAGRLLNSN
jgi:5'-methylthioadenosine phosphorylase